ncbi:MAG TPA: hypothetical protein VLJ86_10080 [Ramlibacter sp.]|nr:hypothetical protein [Ramlibacter sp.]
MTHKHMPEQAPSRARMSPARMAVRVALALPLVLALASCGGGDGGAAVVTDPLVGGSDVPTSATTSAAGAFAFVKSVADTSSETADPLRLGDATLATSETDDPQLL